MEESYTESLIAGYCRMRSLHDNVAVDAPDLAGGWRVDVDQVDRLITEARRACAHAYAPYSRMRVGAAVLANGRIYRGCNVEHALYTLTICAERAAVCAAVAAGRQQIDAVAIVSDAPGVLGPCTLCRQVLAEFGPTMMVIMSIGAERIIRALLALELPSP